MKLKFAVFSLLSIFLTLAVHAEPIQNVWTLIELPQDRQTSQVEAGYPMGCEITSMFYALKFGPTDWQLAYKNIPGDTDLQKIRSLVAKFSSIPSQFSKGQPAFSEQYGMNPNDVSWMVSMLLPNSVSMKMTSYFARSEADLSERNQLLKNFQSDVTKSISTGRPIIMDVTFSNPLFSHAVLVSGIRNSINSDNTITIQILDPMTGRQSEASMSAGSVKFGDTALVGMSFYDREVVDNKGTILSIHL